MHQLLVPHPNRSLPIFPPFSGSQESGKFLKLQTRLQPIAAHFSRLGKLEKFEVSETPSKDRRLAAGRGAAPSDPCHVRVTKALKRCPQHLDGVLVGGLVGHILTCFWCGHASNSEGCAYSRHSMYGIVYIDWE